MPPPFPLVFSVCVSCVMFQLLSVALYFLFLTAGIYCMSLYREHQYSQDKIRTFQDREFFLWQHVFQFIDAFILVSFRSFFVYFNLFVYLFVYLCWCFICFCISLEACLRPLAIMTKYRQVKYSLPSYWLFWTCLWLVYFVTLYCSLVSLMPVVAFIFQPSSPVDIASFLQKPETLWIVSCCQILPN